MGELSPRERQVLQLILDGMSNREIGQFLGISPRTVEVHRAKILLKSKSRTMVQLAQQQALEDAGQPENMGTLRRRLKRLRSELGRIRDEIDQILAKSI